jgi:hypothetical protein
MLYPLSYEGTRAGRCDERVDVRGDQRGDQRGGKPTVQVAMVVAVLALRAVAVIGSAVTARAASGAQPSPGRASQEVLLAGESLRGRSAGGTIRSRPGNGYGSSVLRQNLGVASEAGARRAPGARSR